MSIYLGGTKIADKAAGAAIPIDTQMSQTSTNPVQNKVITEALEDVGYSTWQKPADWVDIRSGALPESVYFLVGHSADYSAYPKFAVKAKISDSGTYDVYVDGIKQATTNSLSTTVLDWQSLALTSGYDVSYPSSYRTHIVRVTPTSSSSTISSISSSELQDSDSYARSGTLWIHFTTTQDININALAGSTSRSRVGAPLLEVITATNNELKTHEIGSIAANLTHLQSVPVFNCQNNQISAVYAFYDCTSAINKITIKNATGFSDSSEFLYYSNIEQVVLENSYLGYTGETFSTRTKLKELAGFYPKTTITDLSMRNMTNIKDAFLDFSAINSLRRLRLQNDSYYNGIKGAVVSAQAPFDYATSPQINVAYTGLNRAALVNLFNSMPYNVGYTVVGSPTITDGVASGFSNSDYLELSTSFIDKGGDLEWGITFIPQDPMVYNNRALTGIKESPVNWSGFQLAEGGIKPYFRINSEEVINLTTNCYKRRKLVLKRTNNVYTLSLYDSATLVEEKSLTTSNLLFNGTTVDITLGYDNYLYNAAYSGSIDLNETYIKVNGVPLFRGTAAMTKTCDVRGCTGTADLTQTDKDIALDKGWSLTVA